MKKVEPRKFNRPLKSWEEVRQMFPMDYSAWVFTEKERQLIKNAFYSAKKKRLKIGVPVSKIEDFINALEEHCSQKKYWSLNRPKRDETRKNREKVLTDSKATLGHLRAIYECKLDLCLYSDMSYNERDRSMCRFKAEIWQLSNKILESLGLFINSLEAFHLSEEKKKGRDRADSDNFVKVIAELYSLHLGQQPKAYSTSAFTEIVKTVYSILNMTSEMPHKSRKSTGGNEKSSCDPSRAVKSAISAIMVTKST